MQKMPRDIEKKIIEKDTVLLAIGLVISMIIVWLTISVPPKEHRKYTKQCYDICKEQVNQELNFDRGAFLVRTEFIIEMGECMDDCTDFSEAIDEDSKDKSMAN